MTRDRGRPAKNIQGINRWLQNWADDTGELSGRLRHRVGVIAVATMLHGRRGKDGEPLFLLKGGSALELRYGAKARVSRDVDLAYQGNLEEIVGQLKAAAVTGWPPFQAAVREPQELNIPWANVSGYRVDVKLSYAQRPFMTMSLEIVTTPVAGTELVDTISLSPVGLDPPEAIPCLSLPYQIAEKIHACTDQLDGEVVNDRATDVMDLILIEDFSFPDRLALPDVRLACIAVFNDRDRHAWPPVVAAQPTWPAIWAQLVEDHQFHVSHIDEAVARVNQFITRIDSA